MDPHPLFLSPRAGFPRSSKKKTCTTLSLTPQIRGEERPGQTLESRPAEPRTPQTAPFGSLSVLSGSLRTLPRAFPGGPQGHGEALGRLQTTCNFPASRSGSVLKPQGRLLFLFSRFPFWVSAFWCHFLLSFFLGCSCLIHSALPSFLQDTLTQHFQGEHCLQEYRLPVTVHI